MHYTYYSDEELVYINDVMDLVLFNADYQTEDVLLDKWFLVICTVIKIAFTFMNKTLFFRDHTAMSMR